MLSPKFVAVCSLAMVTVVGGAVAALAPMQGAPAKAPAKGPPAKATAAKATPATPAAPPAVAPVDHTDPETIRVYLVPMGQDIDISEIDPDARVEELAEVDCCGQLGTDIPGLNEGGRASLYEEIIDDIKLQKPDLIVYELYSSDLGTKYHLGANKERSEMGLFEDDPMRRMVHKLREETGYDDAHQIMWVRDSIGFGSLLALSWPQMYMSSTARLGGLMRVMERAFPDDPQVKAKFREAFVAISNGFLQQGGYPLELGIAMMRPEKQLSARWDGRKIVWLNDTTGLWVVDDTDKDVANFTADRAEELGLCDGIADDLDELMFQLGHRHWVQVNGDGKETVRKYIIDWRKAYLRCEGLLRDYQEHQGNASGDEALKYLGLAKAALEKIKNYMERYPAVATRLRMEHGLDMLGLDGMIGRLGEQIRGIRSNRGNSGGGGGGGGSGHGLGR